MGDSLPVTTIRPFQIISAEETIIPKLKTWKKNCRTGTGPKHQISFLLDLNSADLSTHLSFVHPLDVAEQSVDTERFHHTHFCAIF